MRMRSGRGKNRAKELGRERGGGAYKHFFKKLVPVYQLLIYPLIGPFWQVTSTPRYIGC